MIADTSEFSQHINEQGDVDDGCAFSLNDLNLSELGRRETTMRFESETAVLDDFDKSPQARKYAPHDSNMSLKAASDNGVQILMDWTNRYSAKAKSKPQELEEIPLYYENEDKENRKPISTPRSAIKKFGFETQKVNSTSKSLEVQVEFLTEIAQKCRKCSQKAQEKGWKIAYSESREQEANIVGEEEEETEEVRELKHQLDVYQKDNQTLRETLAHFKKEVAERTDQVEEMEERLEECLNENQGLKRKLFELESERLSDEQDVHKTERASEIVNLQAIIEQLTQERDELQRELKSYEEEEELVSQEVEQHRKTMEETQLFVVNFKRSCEEQINHVQDEKIQLSKELDAMKSQLEDMKVTLENSESLAEQFKFEKLELIKLFTAKNENNMDDIQTKINAIESEGSKLGDFVAAFNTAFQDFLEKDPKEFADIGEESNETKATEYTLEDKLGKIRILVLRYFELKERLDALISEKDELLKRLDEYLPENAGNAGRIYENDNSKNQLIFELNETNAALEQQQEQIKELTNYVQQLEHEKKLLCSKLEVQGQSGMMTPQNSRIFELLDGTLEIVFTAEESRAMTLEQKLFEVQSMIRGYQELKDECYQLAEEKSLLNVTLDSVTNKLKAQQSEIEFLNKQIDVMRKEVAALINMDEFKSGEKLKAENRKLKETNESLKANNEKLEKELVEGKSSLETLKTENQAFSKKLEELQETYEKSQKEIKTLSSSLSEKVSEIESLQQQNRDLKAQNEEIKLHLDSEREECDRKEEELIELSHQLSELSGRFENVNMLLEHERNESYKKERNLNDLIQQVSQLIQKNEKVNEQLLHEKERGDKHEEAALESQQKIVQLTERIEELKRQLEEKRDKSQEQELLIAELRSDLEDALQNAAYTARPSVYSQEQDEGYKVYQSKLEESALVFRNVVKLLAKDANDTKSRGDAISALKKEFSGLLEQNRKLAQTVEEVRAEMLKAAGVQENSIKMLRGLDLSIPEKIFELSNQGDQLMVLAKEFDKLEQERRKLAASLEAQKDDSAAKEVVIMTLKSQNSSLLQSQDTLNKVRESILSKDIDKKDAAKRLEALKTFFTKIPKFRYFTHSDLPSSEQALIKQKDAQIIELHTKIQKLLSELRLKGYDLRQQENPSEDNTYAKPADNNTSSQLNQMMELMTNLVNSKNDQSVTQCSQQLQEENKKLKERLQKSIDKINEIREELSGLILENKTLKQKLEKTIKTCMSSLENEITLLNTGDRNIDQKKLAEFLSKISKSLLHADKHLAKFGNKEELIKKQLTTIAEANGEFEETEREPKKGNEEPSYEGDSDQETKNIKRKTKRQQLAKANRYSDHESEDMHDDDEVVLTSAKKSQRTSAILSAAPGQVTVKSSLIMEPNQMKMMTQPSQLLQQNPGSLNSSMQFTRAMVVPTSPQHKYESEQFSFNHTQQPGVYVSSPIHQRTNSIPSIQIPDQLVDGGRFNNLQQPQQDPTLWKSKFNNIQMTDPNEFGFDHRENYRCQTQGSQAMDYQLGKPESRFYFPNQQNMPYVRDRYNSALISEGDLREFLRQPTSARAVLVNQHNGLNNNYVKRNESFTSKNKSRLNSRNSYNDSMLYLISCYLSLFRWR